ncbi:hypothetical protein FWK35_00012861 [Aphis craccivora]|uniref:Uncharacterized protein n=1 Tax=Aphis craccivora TaxID=307492 RepID=A0A6G0YQ77_APHCR|nr:hypothetical protein FWK35_00012861 [Aphis craccivora]
MKISIFDLRPYKKIGRKLVMRKNSRFSYQLDSLSYQKQGSLFKIEALLLLQNVLTEKIKKKNTHHLNLKVCGNTGNVCARESL